MRDVGALAAAGVGLIAFHLARAGESLGHEELTWWFELARSWSRTGSFVGADGAVWADHSPLYAILLAGVFDVAGEGVAQARALGLAFGLASLVVFWRLTRALVAVGAVPERWVPAALMLYALHPMTLQSTLALEPDTTLAPLCMLLFADLGVRSGLFASPRALAGGGVLLVAIAAAKLYDVAPALAAVAVASLAGAGPRATLARLTGLLAVAAVVTAIVWGVMSHGLGVSMARPFAYLVGGFLDRVAGGGHDRLPALLKDAGQMALWLSPVLVAGAAAGILAGLRRGSPGVGATFIATWGVLHVVALGTSAGLLYGFPKYEAPAVPLLVLGGLIGLSSAVGHERLCLRRPVVVGLSCGALLALLVGDLLLVARIEIKETALIAPADVASRLAWLVGAATAFFALPFAVSIALSWREGTTRTRVAAALLAAHVSFASGLVLRHVGADYGTRYAYGERGVAETASLLRREARTGEVIAPHPVAFALGRPYLREGAAFWRGDDGSLVARVRHDDTAAIVFSFAHHELRQLRYLTTDAELATAFADGGYRRARVGTFVVWYRPRLA